MKRYYDQKVSKGLDLKEGDKVYLLTKNFESKRPNKKLNHVKMGLFKKIHPVYHIAMLEPVHGDYKPLIYK